MAVGRAGAEAVTKGDGDDLPGQLTTWLPAGVAAVTVDAHEEGGGPQNV